MSEAAGLPDRCSASTNLDQGRRLLGWRPINCLALGTGSILPFGLRCGLNETAPGLASGLGRIGMTHAVGTIHNHLAVDGGDTAGSIEGRSHRCSCSGADGSNCMGRQTSRRCAWPKEDLTGRLPGWGTAVGHWCGSSNGRSQRQHLRTVRRSSVAWATELGARGA